MLPSLTLSALPELISMAAPAVIAAFVKVTSEVPTAVIFTLPPAVMLLVAISVLPLFPVTAPAALRVILVSPSALFSIALQPFVPSLPASKSILPPFPTLVVRATLDRVIPAVSALRVMSLPAVMLPPVTPMALPA